MRNKALRLTLLLALTAALVAMTGCAKPTLESYFEEHPEEATAVQDSMNQAGGGLMECTFSAKGNTANYVLKFTKTYNEGQINQMKTALEKDEANRTEMARTTIAELKEKAEVEDITYHLEYQNGDGTVIYATDIKE